MGVYEGYVFQNVPNIADSGFFGRLFTSNAADAGKFQSSLGRSCVSNLLVDSGPFSFSNADMLPLFSGHNVAPAASASSIQISAPDSAGNTVAT